MAEEVSILPGVGMLGLFPHMKYRAWYALGELVDNAIQSAVANREALVAREGDGYRLRVEIEISKGISGQIVVRDNAAGITPADWDRAFRVAEPPPDATGLSQFGIGMKAACCWFAKRWSLRTSIAGELVSRSVLFDVPRILETRNETAAVTELPVRPESHFTEILMWDLHRLPQTKTLGKMKSYLGSMYREFLRDGFVEILFDGEPVTYEEPQVLKAASWVDPDGPLLEWSKDVDVTLNSGRRVTGFVALRDKGSTSEAGLALLYRGKVVTGAGEDLYKPESIFGKSNSFRSQRLFGEMRMDAFDVTYTKDALVWYDEEEEFLDLLRAEADREPLSLLRQAENYRVRRPEIPPVEVVNDVLQRIVDVLPATIELLAVADDLAYSGGSDHATRPDPAESLADRTVSIVVNGRPWQVTLRMVTDDAREGWLQISRANELGSSSVDITINRADPFMRNFAEIPTQELEPVWRLAIGLGLAQELARDGGNKASYVVLQLNRLLREHLGRQV